ncbi:MAG TPA: cell division protein ZapA [Chitinophagaceae bacterium]|nr:cell division protein ZapA [Chitinophagaceae bacterium]
MTELIAISALIGDRTFRIKIEPIDEEVVRKTLKSINDKILEFKTNFAGKDMQDYISMVLIWFATEQNAAMAEGVKKENVIDGLNSIEKLLDNQLK